MGVGGRRRGGEGSRGGWEGGRGEAGKRGEEDGEEVAGGGGGEGEEGRGKGGGEDVVGGRTGREEGQDSSRSPEGQEAPGGQVCCRVSSPGWVGGGQLPGVGGALLAQAAGVGPGVCRGQWGAEGVCGSWRRPRRLILR